jgi:hypothetical protein
MSLNLLEEFVDERGVGSLEYAASFEIEVRVDLLKDFVDVRARLGTDGEESHDPLHRMPSSQPEDIRLQNELH